MSNFLVKIQEKFQNCLESQLKHFRRSDSKPDITESLTCTERYSSNALELNLDKQMQAWKENSYWVDQPPKIEVTIPKGSLCNLNLRFEVGLPPDAVFNIITDPNNKRVFKNIKKVISRKVLVDEGLRQVVEVEQAAIWRFLWWSGTLAVHVYVDQNRKDHTVKFKQGKSGFMRKFEGYWRIEPLFVDDQLCYPQKPQTLAEYNDCSGGKGRVGSVVNLDQLIEPSIVPPPPISWYLRGITTKTTEMLCNDLIAEAVRLRGAIGNVVSDQKLKPNGEDMCNNLDIKERWRQRRAKGRWRRLTD